MILVPQENITFDASERTITLTPPYNTVEFSSLKTIYNQTALATMYDVETRSDSIVSVSTGVITFAAGLFAGIEDTDDLQIFMYDGLVPPRVVNRPHKYQMVDDGVLLRQAYKYDIAIDGVAYMLIKSSATKYPHMIFSALADGDTRFEIYHTPTISLDGTEEPSGNFNFNSDKVSETTWFPTPTVTDAGSYIGNTYILGGSGAGTPAASEGAATLSDFNIVLIPSVNFLIKFTNYSGRAIQVLFEAVYVERDYDYSTL